MKATLKKWWAAIKRFFFGEPKTEPESATELKPEPKPAPESNPEPAPESKREPLYDFYDVDQDGVIDMGPEKGKAYDPHQLKSGVEGD